MFEGVELLELGRRLAATDRRACSAGERLAGIVELVRFQSLLSATVAHELADIDADGLCDRLHGMKTATWVAREAETAPRPLARDLRVGKALRSRLSLVDEAVSTGQVSFAHASVLAGAVSNRRVGDQVAELQAELLEAAKGCTFGRWQAETASTVNLLDQDGGHDPNEDFTKNELRLSPTLDGMLKLDGQLTHELGERIRQPIEAKADEIFRRSAAESKLTSDLAVPSRATLNAQALVELIEAGLGVDLHATTGPRTATSFIVPALEPDQACDETGVRLADGSVRTLLCDADLYPVVVDSLGVPLDMGRKVRLATPHQRKAIAVRDGGCVFPGCENPITWCDYHHLDQHQHGGETNLDRLAPLCRRHHGVVHRRGWNMHATHDGWFWFQTPSGDRLWSQRHQRKRPHPPPYPDAPTGTNEQRSGTQPPTRSQAA